MQAAWSILNRSVLYRFCYTSSLVKQLKSCFLWARLHLPHQCVFEYIAVGCPSLRSIKTTMNGINPTNLHYKACEPLLKSIDPKGPIIPDKQRRIMYRTLRKLKQAQKLYHDAWRTDDPTTADLSGVVARYCIEEADKLIDSASEEFANEPKPEDSEEVEIQERFLLMCSMIVQSVRDVWDDEHITKWLQFWERMKVT